MKSGILYINFIITRTVLNGSYSRNDTLRPKPLYLVLFYLTPVEKRTLQKFPPLFSVVEIKTTLHETIRNTGPE